MTIVRLAVHDKSMDLLRINLYSFHGIFIKIETHLNQLYKNVFVSLLITIFDDQTYELSTET